MQTTDQEKRIINEIIYIRTAKRRKWTYLLYDLIAPKLASDRSYTTIANWLSREGLEISENALRQLVWVQKQKLKSRINQSKKEGSSITESDKSISSLTEDTLKQTELKGRDLNAELRAMERDLKNKNSGFDAFKDL